MQVARMLCCHCLAHKFGFQVVHAKGESCLQCMIFTHGFGTLKWLLLLERWLHHFGTLLGQGFVGGVRVVATEGYPRQQET